jgi:hydroxyacylglutathione hydrolase
VFTDRWLGQQPPTPTPRPKRKIHTPIRQDAAGYARTVLAVAFPAAAFATNCYVIAPAPGEECLVVDPGIGVLDTLRDVFAEHRLRPAAVLLTHGHLDHVYSVTPVCRGAAPAVAPAYIHEADRYRLADPLRYLDPMIVAAFEQQFGAKASWTEPDDVRVVGHDERLSIAGIDLRTVHAPGHTEGSVMFGIGRRSRPACPPTRAWTAPC